MSEQPEGQEDVRGYHTITLDGGPALAGNLAILVRIAAKYDWPHRPRTTSALIGLADALESARFTEVREIQVRQRPPDEVRERLLSSPLPPAELAETLADEVTGQ